MAEAQAACAECEFVEGLEPPWPQGLAARAETAAPFDAYGVGCGGGGTASIDVYENGAAVVSGATRLDFKDLNVESDGSGIAGLYLDLPGLCQGRLTLTSGTPVTTADVTGAGTLYFTPFLGARVALYDGTRWKVHRFTERSLALSVSSGKNYDVFLYDNAGTLTLELSAAWTNDTTRADALATQDGVYVKSGATTRRYLGTIRASAANATEDSGTKRYVWNAYNRAPRKLKRTESTDSWTYSTNSWRPWNNSTTNRVEFVLGMAETYVELLFAGRGWQSAAGNTIGAVGIDLDGTTANDADIFPALGSGTESDTSVAKYADYPGLGYHYLQLMEIGYTSGTSTWIGDAGTTWVQTGAVGSLLG